MQKKRLLFSFLKKIPEYLLQGFKGGTVARLKRNLYGSKSAPKLWYDCLYQVIIELGFKSVAGHPCLFIRVTRIGNNVNIIVIGIFVDDLLVTGISGNPLSKTTEKR